MADNQDLSMHTKATLPNNDKLPDAYFQLTQGLTANPDLKGKQAVLIDTLDKMVPYGHCYFVYEMQNKAITHRRGIQRFLGFEDEQYAMADYLNALHPALRAMQGIYSTGFVKALAQGELPLDIETTYFQYSQAIQHKNGHYLFVRRTLIPFNYTSDHRLLAWLNLFTFINDYEVHPFRFQGCSFDVVANGKTDRSVYEKYVHTYIAQELTKQKKREMLHALISPNHRKTEEAIETSIRLLHEYVVEKHPSAENIAKKMFAPRTLAEKSKAVKMVNNRCSDLVQTMHKTYGMDHLSTAKDIAEFFHTQGLLPL